MIPPASPSFRTAGSRPERSTRAALASAPPPAGRRLPARSSIRAPSPARIPAPPSVVALPPTPIRMGRAPPRSAASKRSPTPSVEERIGSGLPARRSSPQASAASRRAEPSGSRHQDASSISPREPRTRPLNLCAPSLSTARSRVPGPPSATAHSTTSAPGRIPRTPRARAIVARLAGIVPFRLPPAATTFGETTASNPSRPIASHNRFKIAHFKIAHPTLAFQGAVGLSSTDLRSSVPRRPPSGGPPPRPRPMILGGRPRWSSRTCTS